MKHMTNKQRTEALIKQYQFDFDHMPKEDIRALIKAEIADFIRYYTDFCAEDWE